MKLEFGYGNTVQIAEIDDSNVIDVLRPNEVEIGLRGEDEVKRALSVPSGTPKLREFV